MKDFPVIVTGVCRIANQAVRRELQALGIVDKIDHVAMVLTPRSDMTGADRAWAARYQAGEILHYNRGSKEIGIERGSYAHVIATDPKQNLLTVQKQNGELATYDPSRLRGISVYLEVELKFAVSERIQFTAPNRQLHLANRDLGTIQFIDGTGRMTVRMDRDSDKLISFHPKEMRHFDHGYAVTSHSSEGLTAERVLVNMDTQTHPELLNTRFAYVSISRASHEACVYTNDSASLGKDLSHDVTKTSALDFSKAQDNSLHQGFHQSGGQQEMPSPGLGFVVNHD